MSTITEVSAKIKQSVSTAFKGNDDLLDMILACLFSGGHVLLEDVPGTGKTVLAKSLAKSTGLPFSRIQCTPDLMPSDVTGSSVWIPSTQTFDFRAGPVMSSVVLVDELNRATPRTQSALLECMAERQVSVDGTVHVLDKPFFVIATQNPVESEGTFPLPEAQKDRFTMTLSIGYPDEEDEAAIITSQNDMTHPVEKVDAAADRADLLACMEEAVGIHVEESVLGYLLAIVRQTRNDHRIASGVSPRGSIALYKSCQAFAAVKGRAYVIPEDIKTLALPVFKNRIILTSDSMLKGYTAGAIIRELLEQIPLPAFRPHVTHSA